MINKTARYLILMVVILCQLAAPLVVSANSDATQQVHTVSRGETLFSIATRYGISVWDIANANDITNVNFIWVGQRLVIPGNTTGNPGAGATDSIVHQVQYGETLARIAARYGVSIQSLISANGLTNPNIIYVGQRLVVSGQGSVPPPPPNPGSGSDLSGRHILVDLSDQRLYAYEGETLVFNDLISSGLAIYPTPVGEYKVWLKVRSQTMSGPGYSLPNVEWVLYFYHDYAIHGTYWHNNFGRPMSHGCVNMTNESARFIYNFADVGTPVIVRW